MRILMIAGEYPPDVGGVGNFVANAARGLRLAGARVRTVTSVPANGNPDEHSLRLLTGLNYKYLKLGSLLTGGAVSAFRERPEIIVAASWPHEGLTAYTLARVTGLPYAVVVHGTEILQARKATARGRAMTTILSSSALLIANSHFTRNLLVEMGFAGPIVVINPPIDVEEVCAHADPALVDDRYRLEGKRVLLTTSRLYPRKGHAQVLRTLGRLRSRYPDLVYVATGEGKYKKTLEEIAAAARVADCVRFAGFVDPIELSSLYQRCDIYVSPGLNDRGDVEGFGISFIEAAAHGKPVIAGNVGGVMDAVVHGETGLVVDSGDEDQLELALVRLLDDGELRSRMGQNGRARARTFSLERQGGALLRSIEEVLDAAR